MYYYSFHADLNDTVSYHQALSSYYCDPSFLGMTILKDNQTVTTLNYIKNIFNRLICGDYSLADLAD